MGSYTQSSGNSAQHTAHAPGGLATLTILEYSLSRLLLGKREDKSDEEVGAGFHRHDRSGAEWRFNSFLLTRISQNINSEAKAWREARMLFRQRGKGFSGADPGISGRPGQVA